jgi:hypothetical protein
VVLAPHHGDSPFGSSSPHMALGSNSSYGTVQ